MSTQPTTIISIVFTTEDVTSLAEDLGIDPEVALDRVNEWTSSITDRAVERINDTLVDVIQYGQP